MEMQQELTPGLIVRNPIAPEWGLGQVQSVVGTRVTVNFENMGKMTINTAVVTLEIVDDGARP
jgi:alpha-D-ribose 1-methylphosphonate 5-triphosphate synthase subunit PhnG